MIEQGKQDRIDVKELLKSYQLDVIGKFVYALELNSARDKDHPFCTNVQKLVDINYKRIAKGYTLGVLPKFVANTARYLIKKRDADGTQGSYHDFLDLLVGTFKDKHQDVPEEEIIGVCIVSYY